MNGVKNEGKQLVESDKIAATWRKYFQKLLNVEKIGEEQERRNITKEDEEEEMPFITN